MRIYQLLESNLRQVALAIQTKLLDDVFPDHVDIDITLAPHMRDWEYELTFKDSRGRLYSFYPRIDIGTYISFRFYVHGEYANDDTEDESFKLESIDEAVIKVAEFYRNKGWCE